VHYHLIFDAREADKLSAIAAPIRQGCLCAAMTVAKCLSLIGNEEHELIIKGHRKVADAVVDAVAAGSSQNSMYIAITAATAITQAAYFTTSRYSYYKAVAVSGRLASTAHGTVVRICNHLYQGNTTIHSTTSQTTMP